MKTVIRCTLFILMISMLFTVPEIAVAEEINENDIDSIWETIRMLIIGFFGSYIVEITAFIGIVGIVSEFIQKRYNTDGIVSLIITYVVAAVLSIIGFLVNFGIFEGERIFNAVFDGLIAGGIWVLIISNFIWGDVAKDILRRIGIRKPDNEG